MKMILKNIFLSAFVFIFTTCATEVDLCYGEHPHRSLVNFQFAWAEEYERNQPDSMLVVADRPINTYRYAFRTTSKAGNNKGCLLFPIEEKTQDSVSHDNSTTLVGAATFKNDIIRMRSGDYQLVTFNGNSEVFHFMGLDDFQKNNYIGIKDLSLSYKSYPRTDSALIDYASWTDYNPYADFVMSNAVPIYYHYIDKLKIPASGEVVTQIFAPKPVTQKINIKFKIAKEKGVSVDSMVAEISGISSAIQLSTRFLTIDKTYKMLFKPTTVTNNKDMLMLDCNGLINVTGIVPSSRKELTTGPGIMQLAVYTHAYDEKNKKVNKIIQVNINLYKTLTDASLIEWNNVSRKYIQRCSEGFLNIKQILQIEKGVVVNSGNTSTGLDYWVQTNRIDIDV